MFTATFDRAYRRLVRAFTRYQDAPRSVDSIAVIGDARWELHLARNDMAIERSEVLATHRQAGGGRKFDVSDADLARLRVEAVSPGFG